MKKYDLLDFDLIRKKWENSVNPIGVYVHSPFCPSICTYCVYAGVLKNNPKDYTDYYGNYLPKIVDLYRPILESKKENIVSWFFGGGTPSMMEADTLRKLLTDIPNFKESKGIKTFEIHPAYWTTELLDVLREFNFDTCIVCLQTFDRKTLIRQKRVPATVEKIVWLCDELRKRKFNVFVDIISFLNDEDEDEEILINDLKLTYELIKPDEVSIQTSYKVKKNHTHKTVRNTMKSDFIVSGEYLVETENGFTSTKDLTIEELIRKNEHLKGLRLSKSGVDQIDSLMVFKAYMDPQYLYQPQIDTLAMGSYRNPYTQTQSNVSDFNYIECNYDNVEPEFKCVKSSFYDDVREILDILEKFGEPPKNATFMVSNDYVNTENEQLPTLLRFNMTGMEDKNKEVNEYLIQYMENMRLKAVNSVKKINIYPTKGKV